MTRIEADFIDCACDKKDCPVFTKCCYLPTELNHSIEGTVEILFVGQGGGSTERKLHRPFIGRSGKRLRALAVLARQRLNKHIGIAFSNTIRDNPLDNRVPTKDELEICLPYLYQDIKTLKSKGLLAVIPLGSAARNALLKDVKPKPITKERGTMYKLKNDVFGEVTVMPSYHPSYLIRNAPNLNPDKLGDLDKALLEDIIKAYNFGKLGD